MILKLYKSDGKVHITSTEGKKIIQVETKRIYSEAIEELEGIHYTYEEVN